MTAPRAAGWPPALLLPPEAEIGGKPAAQRPEAVAFLDGAVLLGPETGIGGQAAAPADLVEEPGRRR